MYRVFTFLTIDFAWSFIDWFSMGRAKSERQSNRQSAKAMSNAYQLLPGLIACCFSSGSGSDYDCDCDSGYSFGSRCDVPATGHTLRMLNIYCDDGHVDGWVELPACCRARNSSNDEVFLLCLLACVLMKHNSWRKGRGGGRALSTVGIHNSIRGQFSYKY